MNKEVSEGNALIAKFMGGTLKPPTKEHLNNPYNKPTWWGVGDRKDARHFQLNYHCSWDWLMPVVEKIGKDYDVRITWTPGGIEVTYIDRPDTIDDDSIADFGGYGSLENTWRCVVKFINWHNQKFK